jgi:hypothetical protein
MYLEALPLNRHRGRVPEYNNYESAGVQTVTFPGKSEYDENARKIATMK